MDDFNQDTEGAHDSQSVKTVVIGGVPKRKQGGKYVHVMIPSDLYDSLRLTAQDFGIVKRGAWNILIRKLLRFALANKSLFSSDSVL